MKQAVLLLTTALSMLFGAAALAHDPPKPPGVVHVVLVWLKEPGNPEHRQQIITGSKQLADIPGVLGLRVGEVIPSERKVVDASYDVALYLRFASVEKLNAYLVHPIHKAAVKEVFLPVMERYKVFDFQDE